MDMLWQGLIRGLVVALICSGGDFVVNDAWILACVSKW